MYRSIASQKLRQLLRNGEFPCGALCARRAGSQRGSEMGALIKSARMEGVRFNWKGRDGKGGRER